MPTEHLKMPKVDAATLAEVAFATYQQLNEAVARMAGDDHVEMAEQKIFNAGIEQSGIIERIVTSAILAGDGEPYNPHRTMNVIVLMAMRLGMRLYPELLKREQQQQQGGKDV